MRKEVERRETLATSIRYREDEEGKESCEEGRHSLVVQERASRLRLQPGYILAEAFFATSTGALKVLGCPIRGSVACARWRRETFGGISKPK